MFSTQTWDFHEWISQESSTIWRMIRNARSALKLEDPFRTVCIHKYSSLPSITWQPAQHANVFIDISRLSITDTEELTTQRGTLELYQFHEDLSITKTGEVMMGAYSPAGHLYSCLTTKHIGNAETRAGKEKGDRKWDFVKGPRHVDMQFGKDNRWVLIFGHISNCLCLLDWDKWNPLLLSFSAKHVISKYKK